MERGEGKGDGVSMESRQADVSGLGVMSLFGWETVERRTTAADSRSFVSLKAGFLIRMAWVETADRQAAGRGQVGQD